MLKHVLNGWLLTVFAAFRHGLTFVTLYSTLVEEAVKHGIKESQVQIIITSQELTSKLEVRRMNKLYRINFLLCSIFLCTQKESTL